MIWLCKLFGHKFSYHWICERCGYHAGSPTKPGEKP